MLFLKQSTNHSNIKVPIIKIFALIFFINTHFAFSQEWVTLKSYQNETGNSFLLDGCWLKKDRQRQTKIWTKANEYNLSSDDGNLKYKTICQKKDFYLWFDTERKKQGHEIKWIGIAAIAANQLSKIDIAFIRIFIVRNKEIVKFAHDGAEKVFNFAFPQLKKVYFSDMIITGKDAENWDKNFGIKEQCEILEPIYQNLSIKAINKLERMAKGKGFFYFGVPKDLKYDGKINNCHSRFEHGMKKLIPYYTKELIDE